MSPTNVTLGKNPSIDPSASLNNVSVGDDVKISKQCSVYGSPENILEIGNGTYIGMNSVINGFSDKVKIGAHVSIAQNVYIMADSGPNASEIMQRVFPIEKGPVTISDHCWIGNGSIIMPLVTLGKFCIVAANSYVNDSFPDYCIIGGTPSRLIRCLSLEEISKLNK
jgi:acetyltransferase-like isoleucine patch superfamily enzyme